MDPDKLEALRRNSGLALTRDGVWMWGTRPVENPRVQAMFHRGVAVRADGEVTLSVGHMWAYVGCPGPAFFVASLGRGAGPMLRLLGDREVPLFPEGGSAPIAGWGPDDRLYLWSEGIGPDGSDAVAICLRDAHQSFAALLVEEPDGLVLAIEAGSGSRRRYAESGGTTGDRRIPVVMLAAIPSPGAARPA